MSDEHKTLLIDFCVCLSVIVGGGMAFIVASLKALGII